ncbi:hypothetical protein [Metabacillus litoralis]|uniref:hypothetical protein n=1 Tax=Metabacillus litoralis TaxID=152268 RepID=UPI0015D5B5D2|nr:hypothetical protein [Metabacillus litoralis]MCM3409838.1 hypothetical protein [Metabacillus litoralis]
MKSKHLISIAVLFMFFFPDKILATSWAYPFVVWDEYIYVISDEYVTEIDNEIGHVTRYSDMEQYSGNFSNAYKQGTKYYSIKGISTDQAIAVEGQNGQYIKANREAEYKMKSPFDGQQGFIKIILFSVVGIFFIVLIYKVIRNNASNMKRG